MAEIKAAYERLAGARTPYLQQGSRNQKYTVQIARDPVSGTIQEFIDPTVHTIIGKIIVKALASTMATTLFPPNIFWFRFAVLSSNKKLDGNNVQHLLSEAERDHMRLFDQILLKSALLQGFMNSAVWGQMVLHLKTEDERGPLRTRTFDLGDHVTEYTDSFLRRVIVREDFKDNPLNDDEKPRTIYTEADHKTGLVRQEDEGVIIEVDDDPARWIVINNQPPIKGEHFSTAIVTEYYKKILHANGMTRAFEEITYEAARIIKGVRAGSGLDPHALNKLKSGAFIVMRRPEDIFYPQQQTQILPGLSVVDEHLRTVEAELKTAFMYGLLDRMPQPDTATLARQLISELNTIGAQFYIHAQDHTQLPIARGLMSITGFKVEGDGGRVEPNILTGISALSRQEEATLLTSVIERFAMIDPEWVRGLPTNKIFQTVTDGLQIETGDIITTEGRVQDIFSELIAVIQEDPQTVLPMLMQLLMQFDPEAVAQLAGEVQTAALEVANPQAQPQQLALPAA